MCAIFLPFYFCLLNLTFALSCRSKLDNLRLDGAEFKNCFLYLASVWSLLEATYKQNECSFENCWWFSLQVTSAWLDFPLVRFQITGQENNFYAAVKKGRRLAGWISPPPPPPPIMQSFSLKVVPPFYSSINRSLFTFESRVVQKLNYLSYSSKFFFS